VLDAMLSRNTTALTSLIENPLIAEASPTDESLQGIRCGDKFLRSKDLGPVRSELFNQMYKTSARFGDTSTYTMTLCAQWEFEAKERYDGEFHVATSYPILLIGNTWDPATPLKSAHNLSAGLSGSVVLQHNGHGASTAIFNGRLGSRNLYMIC
jgi:hypothetical protein